MDGQVFANRFPTTSWTLIRRATASRDDLGELLACYMGPVYAYIVRKGYPRHDAEDLMQGFFAHIIEKGLIGDVDADKGRFRTFLLTVLHHFMIDEFRRRAGRAPRKQHEGNGQEQPKRPTTIPVDPEILDAAEPDASDSPEKAFNRQWATTVLNLALAQVEGECRDGPLAEHWSIYEARFLRPIVSGCGPGKVDELAQARSLTRQDVYSMSNSVQRKVNTAMRLIVLETLEDPADLDAELTELRRALGSALA